MEHGRGGRTLVKRRKNNGEKGGTDMVWMGQVTTARERTRSFGGWKE